MLDSDKSQLREKYSSEVDTIPSVFFEKIWQALPCGSCSLITDYMVCAATKIYLITKCENIF